MSKASDAAKAKFEKDFKSGKMTKVTGEVGAGKKLVIKAGGKVLAAVAGKKAATKAVAVSSRNASKAAETRSALKAAKSKPPLATPKSTVNVVKAKGKSYNKVANQKEAARLTRNPMPKSQRTSPLPDKKVAKIPVSKNVTARVPAKSNYEFAKDMSRFGKIQKQNAGPLEATKAEAKANARGLKAAQGKSLASPSKKAVSKQNAEGRAKLNSLRNRFKK